MSIYIDSSSYLHHHSSEGPTLTCPHCQAVALMSPLSLPRFSALTAHKPNHVGVVYRCNACNQPVFLKYPVKSYTEQRIELSPQYIELEQPREKFTASHLPSLCETLFKEALTCFTHGAYLAFALMCRRTTQAMFKELGDNGRLKIFDLLVEIRDIAALDTDTFMLAKTILFDNDTDHDLPPLNIQQAGTLLEIMKDLLYQCYTRRAKLQQAIRMRSFFAEERNERTTMLKAVT